MISRDDCLLLAVPPPQERWCWHCCHPFPGEGVPLPTSYDDRRNTFTTLGIFCSFACIKAYNCDNYIGNRDGVRSNLMTLLKKRMTGKLTPTIPAPPRCRLNVFGGTMSIDEFRAKSGENVIVTKLPPRMVPLETIIHAQKVEANKVAAAPGPNLKQEVDLTTATQNNETLRLKRPRPMPTDSDVLARTMGLEFS